MIAMTTSSSTSVNALREGRLKLKWLSRVMIVFVVKIGLCSSGVPIRQRFKRAAVLALGSIRTQVRKEIREREQASAGGGDVEQREKRESFYNAELGNRRFRTNSRGNRPQVLD